MVGRFSFWRYTVLAGVIGLLAAAAPAGARSVTIEDKTSVTFQWAESIGPVAGYFIMVHRNGALKPVFHSTVNNDNRVTVEGAYGESLQISVAAIDESQRLGPISEISDVVHFVSTSSPPDPGGTDPDPDPNPEPDPEPNTDPDPDPSPEPSPEWYPYTRYDHDGDGFADLLVRKLSKEALKLWSLDGEGILDINSVKNFGSKNVPVGNGDYNGDGFADILWFDVVNFRVSLSYVEDGRVRDTIVITEYLEAPSEIAGSGDYNGDGLSDILIFTPSTNHFTIWTSNTDAFISMELPNDFGNDAEVIASGDFDGDGMADILWRDRASKVVEIWGTTQDITLGPLEGGESSWLIMGAGDFDGDNRDDVLLQHSSNGDFSVRLSSNGVRTKLDSVLNSKDGTRLLATTGDYNGDGRLDLVVEHADIGEVWVYFLNGTRSIGSVQIDSPDSSSYFASTDARPNSRRGERR